MAGVAGNVPAPDRPFYLLPENWEEEANGDDQDLIAAGAAAAVAAAATWDAMEARFPDLAAYLLPGEALQCGPGDPG